MHCFGWGEGERGGVLCEVDEDEDGSGIIIDDIVSVKGKVWE